MYVNDIISVCLYADDTTLYCWDNFLQLFMKNRNFPLLQNSVKHLKLLLNAEKKHKYMFFPKLMTLYWFIVAEDIFQQYAIRD